MIVRYLLAIAVVVLLLLALRWALGRYMTGGGFGQNSRQQRLSVVDVVSVDARRRLVLVRRDNVEHLILIGGPADLLVEPTIIRGVPVGSLGPRYAGKAGSVAPAASGAAAGTVVTEAAVQPEIQRPEPVPMPPPVRAPEPATRFEPQPPAPQPPPPSAQPNSPSITEAGPYVPPEAAPRPVVPAEPIAPIIEPRPTTIAAKIAERRSPEAQAARERSYDDLARRLDEALRIDGLASPADPVPAAPYPRPSRGPASRSIEPVMPPTEPRIEPAPLPEPIPSPPPAAAEAPAVPPAPVEPAPENVIELPSAKPASRFASAWFRPRKTAEPEPAAGEPPVQIPPVVTVALPAAAVAASSMAAPSPALAVPSVESTELRKSLADDLARILQEEPIEEMLPPGPPVAAAPETTPEDAVVEELKVQAASSKPVVDEGLASLEDEMARLLDELAGENKTERR